MISSDGFHSLEDSVVTYQQHLETRSTEAFQNEPVNRLSLQLKNYLQLFNPVDLIIAINVLELWLPNISSGFKFSLLLNTFYLSLKSNSLTRNRLTLIKTSLLFHKS